jgi:hypothetical protein
MGMVLKLLRNEYLVLALALMALALLPQLPEIPLCPTAALLHHACPTCGVLRGLWQFMHGNFQTAWAFNPISYLVIALCARRLFILISGRRWAAVLESRPVDFVFLGLFFWFAYCRILNFTC